MVYKLQESDFTTTTLPIYSDPEGDSPFILKIVGLPEFGELRFNNELVEDEQEFSFPDAVRNGNLEYISGDNKNEHTDTIQFKLADRGSKLFSNIGTLTIDIPEECSAPVVNGNTGNLTSKTYVFSNTDFIQGFRDDDGDSYSIVTIKTTTNIPQLRYNGKIVTEELEFLVEDSENLTYVLPERYAVYDGEIYEFEKSITSIILEYENAGYRLVRNEEGVLHFTNTDDTYIEAEIEGTLINTESLCFNFTTSDDSDKQLPSNEATFCIIPQGNINVKEPYINQPPVVGNLTIEINNREDYEFTINSFTTDTVPRYSDPEGDAPSIIRIETLPVNGNLLIGTQTVNEGDEIEVSDINSLKYVSDKTNIEYHEDTFTFTIKDDQSEEFSNVGTVYINILEQEAVPPVVDDVNIQFNEDRYTFKLEDFTHNFYDENGDDYNTTRIETLPSIGVLSFNEIDLEGQFEFDLTEVENLKYRIPDNYKLTTGGYYTYNDNIEDIKNNYVSQGYEVADEQPRRIVFQRSILEGVPYDTDVYAFFDTTSMDIEDGQAAHDALEEFVQDFRNEQPDYTGNLYIIPINAENWLSYPEIIHRGSSTSIRNNANRPDDDFMAIAQLPPNFDITSINENPNWEPPKNLMVLAFIDEVAVGSTEYHFENVIPRGLEQQPTTKYLQDYERFVNLYNNEFNFFRGVYYPIPDITYTNYNNQYNASVLQGFAAIEGGSTYTTQQMEELGVVLVEERQFDKVLDVNSTEYIGTNTTVANPYSIAAQTEVPNSNLVVQGLRSFGWLGVYDKRTPASEVFSSLTFETEISEYLIGNETEVQEQIVIEGTFTPSEETCFTFRTSDDSTYKLFSNEAKACLSSILDNNPPTVSDNTTRINNRYYSFNEGSFTKDFHDIDGDGYDIVTIKSLPSIKGLYYINTPIEEGFIFSAETSSNLEFILQDRYAVYNSVIYDFGRSIDQIIEEYDIEGYDLTNNISGELTFSQRGNYTNKRIVRGERKDINSTCFSFTISDDNYSPEESNEALFCITIEGNINIKGVIHNNPPIVEDSQINTKFGRYYIFKEDDFEYTDPEGDLPYQIKIETLPQHGALMLRGSTITTAPTIINYSEVLLGNFGYDYDGTEFSTFEYEMSDVGSGQFSDG